jgi:hypothetical protein
MVKGWILQKANVLGNKCAVGVPPPPTHSVPIDDDRTQDLQCACHLEPLGWAFGHIAAHANATLWKCLSGRCICICLDPLKERNWKQKGLKMLANSHERIWLGSGRVGALSQFINVPVPFLLLLSRSNYYSTVMQAWLRNM